MVENIEEDTKKAFTTEFDEEKHKGTILKLQCKTGEIVELDAEYAGLSGLLRNILENFDVEKPIEIEAATKESLEIAVRYLLNMKGVPVFEIPKPLKDKELWEYCSDFELELVEDKEIDYLVTLLDTANFMDIPNLMSIAAAQLAIEIMDKTPDEIRKLFNIECDFTPEELKEMEGLFPDDIE